MRRVLVLSVLLSTTAFVVACGGGGSTGGGGAASGPAKQGGTLTVGLAEDPDQLDPTLARTFVAASSSRTCARSSTTSTPS